MTAASRRRTVPTPAAIKADIEADLADARLRARGRDAIAKIITLEPQLDDLAGPELRFTVGLLEWMAGFPAGGAR